eukprot:782789-Pelagomonas_calceolata.AAC.1
MVKRGISHPICAPREDQCKKIDHAGDNVRGPPLSSVLTQLAAATCRAFPGTLLTFYICTVLSQCVLHSTGSNHTCEVFSVCAHVIWDRPAQNPAGYQWPKYC